MVGKASVDWQILTKRPQRALDLLNSWGALPDNVWMGVTCENQKRLDERLPVLRKIKAAVRWLSIEPMLGPVELQAASGALSELRARDRGLKVRHGALMGDPAAHWEALRDVEDERRFLKVAIQRAATARDTARQAVTRTEQRAQDSLGI